MSTGTAAVMSAAPIPWTSLNTVRDAKLPDSPQATDETVNTTIPQKNTLFTVPFLASFARGSRRAARAIT